MAELSSCQSGPEPSDQSSELDSDDSAFAKTPIRPDDDGDDDSASIASDVSSVSSDASMHFNERGDRTYFHVWSDMLTCNEMTELDLKAETEVPNYVEGDELENPNIHKPLSVDTSLPCPLIQFGPIPKRRSNKKSAASTATDRSDLAGDDTREAEPTENHHHHHHHDDCAEGANEASALSECEGHQQHRDERCCDFSVVAAKNNARHKVEARLRKLERKRLVRY